ncbi:hypothetical protein ZEAMMB73_Zm00001d015906 [Zea mays]|uniref:Apyrase 1 n=2 Tax=Zea mays TaxID=4577 RepID=A0A1D6H4J9_MAIZE|nr:hypothetical protein ZEAMMB73_Zm00001d015906 [Zea mays]
MAAKSPETGQTASEGGLGSSVRAGTGEEGPANSLQDSSRENETRDGRTALGSPTAPTIPRSRRAPSPANPSTTQQQIHHRRARRAPRRGTLDPAQQEAANQSSSPPAPTPPAAASGVRYRTPSSPDLLLPADAAKMRRYSALPNDGLQEMLADHAHRYWGVVLVILAPLALISLVLLLMPRSPAGTMGGARSHRGNASESDGRRAPSARWCRWERFALEKPLKVNNVVSFSAATRWSSVMRKRKHMSAALALVDSTKWKSPRYAVIFDVGSSGSRIHVFRFDANLDLVRIGSEIELFVQATAGLRNLGAQKSEALLQAVRDLLREKSSFKNQPDWVTVLDY